MRRFDLFVLALALSSALSTQHSALLRAQVITTIAGGQWVFRGDGGLAVKASLGNLYDVASDANGNLYTADYYNNVVVRISPGGVLTVIAGNGIEGFSGDGGPATSASFSYPRAVAVDSAGNVFVADEGSTRVRRVSRDGIVVTVAGGGGSFGDGIPATKANLNSEKALAVDGAGNLYIGVYTTVYRVSPEGIITTFAGTGYGGFSGDGGPATQAQMGASSGLLFNGGNLYIATYGRIRKVGPDGRISTIAGNGNTGFSGDGGPALSASMTPLGLAMDANGNLFFSNFGSHRIRKIDRAGIVSTVAGTGKHGFSGDDGPALKASFAYPWGLAIGPSGDLFVADNENDRLRRITSDGRVVTVAGNGGFKFSGDGGPAAFASLNGPSGLAMDRQGNLFAAEVLNSRVRKIDPRGLITTVAGNGLTVGGGEGDGGPATSAPLGLNVIYSGIAVDAWGNVYFSELFFVRKINPNGILSTVAGSLPALALGDGGPATQALVDARGLTVDGAGSLFIADKARIRKVNAAGIISTVAGNGIYGDSGDGGPATAARLGPKHLALDPAGNLYVSTGNFVRRVTPGGTISTVAGNGYYGFSGDGGPPTSAAFSDPEGIAIDFAGRIYIADFDCNRVRVIENGVVRTVAGNGRQEFSGDGGAATEAGLPRPDGIAVDGQGNLFITDHRADRIRKVLAAAPAFAAAPASLTFSATTGSAAVTPQLAAVTSAVSGLAWAASTSAPWLGVAPASGTAPGLISVGVTVSNLSPGAYRGTVTVQAPLAANPIQTIAVELTVLAPGDAKPTVDTPSLTFETTAAAGNPPAKTLRISNAGSGSLQWTARPQTLSGGNWLTLSSTSGTASSAAPAAVYVSARAAGLSPGVYSGLITIESPSSTQPQTVAVDLLISQVTQTISLSQTALRFTAVEGEATAPQKFGIVNTGQGVMNWTARAETVNGGSWLSVSPAGGQSEAGSVIVSQAEAAANTRGLPRGTYAGFIRVDAPGANNSPRLVTVVLTVLPAGSKTGTRLSPSGLIFTARAGGGSPSSQLVNLTTSNPGQVSAAGQPFTINGGDWLKVLPTNLAVSASDPRSIVVQPVLEKPDRSLLGAGEYRASLTFMFDDGSPAQAVDIYFLVVGSTVSASAFSEAAAAGCTAKKLIAVERSLGPNFTAQVGAASGLEVQVADDCGNMATDATVVANLSNGDAPVSLSYLRDGIYTGTWRPGKAGPAVTVTLRSSLGSLPSVEILRQGKVEEGAKTAAVFPGGVVHAASFTPNGALAPGSIISVFGANLASTSAGASSLPLPKTLAGASLQVGGYEVPLFYSSGGQINAQLPFELPPNSRPQLIVKGADFVTVPETITVAAARPGVFTTTQDGKGQGVIMDVNNRLVDASNPAKAGDVVVVYCTGLGTTNPAVRSGEAAPASPLARVVTPVTVTIGGQPATVQYAGLTPGFAGLYQVNVQVPSGVTPGASVPLVISQDGVPSNTVALAIQ